MNGSKDDVIVVNYNAALVWLGKLDKSDTIDNTDMVKECNK